MRELLALVLMVLPYLLMAGGAVMAWRGASVWIRGAGRGRGSTGRLLEMVIGFRQAIVGLGLIGLGAWLLTRETWLLALALAVAAEEVFETGTIIKALRSDPRLRAEANQPPREPARRAQ